MSRKPDRLRYTGVAPYSDQAQLIRCQSLTSSTDFTQERLLELANLGHTEIIDEATVSATLEFNDYGGTDNFAALMGQGQYNSSRTNDYVISDNIFENASVDITAKVATDDSTIARTIWIGNASLTGFSMSYSVDGVATESYDFEGDFKRWFLNTYAHVKAYKADFSSATTALVSGTNLQNGTEAGLLVTVNNEVISDLNAGDAITLLDASSDTTITTDTPLALVDGDRIRLLTYDTAKVFPTLPSTPDGLGGLRKDMIEVYLWNPDTGTEQKGLRIQSVDLSVDLGRETRDELGNNKPYYRSLTRPIDVSVNVEFLDSDLEAHAKLAGNETTFDADTLSVIDIDDFVRDNKLFIKCYKSETTHTNANLLKMIEISNLSVSSEEGSVAVGDDATWSVSMSADNFMISGSAVNPIL